MQQRGEPQRPLVVCREGRRLQQRFDQQRVLRHRKDVSAVGLSVPARDPRQSVRDVLDRDIRRRGVQQVETAARQHALPGSRDRPRL